MKRNSQELLLGGTRARGNHRFRETRLAAAIALGMALVGVPCLTQAQDANTDAPATTAPESAAMAPSKKNTAAKPDVSEMGAITVTGIRASLMSAQSLKQNADQIIDSVTATDINALPDRSVTETLQRISGVTVDHFLADDDPNHPAAEGSGVLIRGLPYVGSLLNGRTSFSANNGRALGFQDVPAELMAGVDVYKNPSAEIIEGGIGGTVNLRTRMPFDTGKTTAFSFGINDGDMAKKHKPAASFLYSNVWESDTYGKFGALFDVAISELSTRSDGVQVQPYVLRPTKTDGPDTWLQDADGNWRNDLGATVADGAPNGEGYVPGGVNWRRMDMDRRRIGLYGGLQWQPNDRWEIYSQFFRSNYNLHWSEHFVQSNEGNFYNPLPANGTNFTYDDRGVFQTGTITSSAWRGDPALGPFGNNAYYTTNRDAQQFTQTTDWSNGFKVNLTDNVILSGDLQLAKSVSNTLDFTVYNQIYMPPLSLDVSGSVPSVTVTDPAYLADGHNYILWSAMDHLQHDYGLERAAKIDLEVNFDSAVVRSLRVGVRATNSHRYSNNTNSSYNWGALNTHWLTYDSPEDLARADTLPSWMQSYETLGNFYRGDANVPTTLWFPSSELVSNYRKAIPALRSHALEGGIWCPQETTDGSCTPGSPMSDNNMWEKTQALYGSLYFGTPDDRFDGNVGLRLVRTSVRSNGSVTFPSLSSASGSLGNYPQDVIDVMFSGLTEPMEGHTSYKNALPSLNLRYKLTDDLQWRFAAGRAITRPAINQLNAYLKVGASWAATPGGQSTLAGWKATSGGNPALKPMISDQFDTSLEWYFAPTGQLYTTLFHKKLKNYIADEIWLQNIAGQTLPVSGPVNAGDGTVKGFEIGYSQFFDFLPGAWRGFGVQANYTYLKSSRIAGTTSCDPNHNNGSCDAEFIVNNQPLPMQGLSPKSYNFTAMYEYGNWSARLAWSWRDRYLLAEQDSGDTYVPVWSDSFGQLDGSVFFNINKNVKVGLLLNNLTNAKTKVLMGPSTYADSDARINNPTLAPSGYVDQNRYLRSTFVNDRRAEVVIRATF